MTDILGCAYAVILLSEAEYDGPFCNVPDLVHHPLLEDTPTPGWVSLDPSSVWMDMYGASSENRKLAGTDHDTRLKASSLAFTAVPRPNDPNAGKSVTDPTYASKFTENFEWKDWAKNLGTNHIGGTMDAVQQAPDFGPCYIGFDEFFGGMNFGGGTAQFDFKDMKFDWACG